MIQPDLTGVCRFLSAVILMSGTTAVAQNQWTSFRGDGSSIVSANLSTEWSADGGIAWQSDIPG